jgi:hypothetical protein
VKEAAGEPESPDVIDAEYGGAVLDEQVRIAEACRKRKRGRNTRTYCILD